MATTASPCINICLLNDSEMCVGCGRTLAEIAEWSSAGAERQRAIAAAAKGRLHETE